MAKRILLAALVAIPFGVVGSCSGGSGGPSKDGGLDVKVVEVAPPPHDGPYPDVFCDLPGSVVYAAGKRSVVEGGKPGAPDLASWLTLPPGFCAHYYAHVATTRQMRSAPGGELFVASPSTATSGGAPPGLGQVIVLYDDDHDGYADGDALPHADMSIQALTVFTSVASVQGLMFAPGFFYYQDDTRIMRVPYRTGQRAPSGSAHEVANITIYVSQGGVHWPKPIDVADDGTIYVGNGGDQGEICDTSQFPRPFHGGILSVGGKSDPVGGTPIAHGFRNPIAVRCEHGKGVCFAVELGLDGSGDEGGREKIVPIRKGDDWGHPCCATTNVPFSGDNGANCASVAPESVSLVIGDTPFGLDFERGLWPAPYAGNMVVALHGAVGSWIGSRVVAVPMQANGMPTTSSDLGKSTFVDLATGWDDGTRLHGRATAVEFAADGRAFIGNDFTGDIFWIAPVGLKGNH